MSADEAAKSAKDAVRKTGTYSVSAAPKAPPAKKQNGTVLKTDVVELGISYKETSWLQTRQLVILSLGTAFTCVVFAVAHGRAALFTGIGFIVGWVLTELS